MSDLNESVLLNIMSYLLSPYLFCIIIVKHVAVWKLSLIFFFQLQVYKSISFIGIKQN